MSVYEITKSASREGNEIVFRTLDRQKAIDKIKELAGDTNPDKWEGQVWNNGNSMVRKWINNKIDEPLNWGYAYSAMYGGNIPSYYLKQHKLD